MSVPEMMLGSFQMETSEGFDEFMYEMGVNMFTRLIIMIRIMIMIRILVYNSAFPFLSGIPGVRSIGPGLSNSLTQLVEI